MNKQKNLFVYSYHKNKFINDRNDNTPNTYYYSNFKIKKKNILPIHQLKNIKQIQASKTTLYSKGKIQEAFANGSSNFGQFHFSRIQLSEKI